MPLEFKSQFDSLLAMVNLCDDNELETLTSRCNKLLQERKTAARNALRQELMTNLQQTISAILDNGFGLTIENLDTSRYDDYRRVCLCQDEHYDIEIE